MQTLTLKFWLVKEFLLFQIRWPLKFRKYQLIFQTHCVTSQLLSRIFGCFATNLIRCFSAQRATEELNLSPLELPRARKIPRRKDDGAEAFNPPDLQSHYRVMFIEAVDLVLNSIDSRINKKSLAPALCIETLIETSLKTAPASNEAFQTVLQYHPSIDISRLQSELFPSIPTNVESLTSLVSWFQESQTRQTAYPETFKMLSLFSVIPVTTATCERSFSCLRHLKHYLRSTVGQLNSILLCAIHTDLLDGLNLEALVHDFVEINDARIKYYSRFKHNN